MPEPPHAVKLSLALDQRNYLPSKPRHGRPHVTWCAAAGLNADAVVTVSRAKWGGSSQPKRPTPWWFLRLR